MRFAKHIFISYAHIDNQPLTPEQQGCGLLGTDQDYRENRQKYSKKGQHVWEALRHGMALVLYLFGH